jgi:hypothetical protein
MSTPAQESAFYDAVLAAEAARQNARSLAQATYGFVKSKYAQFVTDMVAADVTYMVSITTAATANGINPNVGLSGPIPCARTAKIGGH